MIIPQGTARARIPPNGASCCRIMTQRVDAQILVSPGQARFCPGQDWRPQQDSNLRPRLRRPMLYPLSYGGLRLEKGTSPAAFPGHATQRRTKIARKTLTSPP
jgi:hypothetical protein